MMFFSTRGTIGARIAALVSMGCTVLCFASCSPTQVDPVPPARDSRGRRILLTPPGGYLGYYSAASTSGPDQPVWVAANYKDQSGTALVVKVDTAGQLLGSRQLNGAGLVTLAALTDGSSLVTRQVNGQIAVTHLGADGSPLGNTLVGLAGSTGQSLLPLGLAAVGNDALLCASLDVGNQRVFTPITAAGAPQPSVRYAFAARTAGTPSFAPVLKPLPAGKGAVILEQLDSGTFLVATVDGTGHLGWYVQLTLPSLPSVSYGTPAFQVAVSPSSGTVAILVAYNAGPVHLVRLSAAGTLLSASTYSCPSPSPLHVGALALGLQDEAAWLAESTKGLYYYAVDAQGNVQASRQVSPAGTRQSVLNAYGLVSMGRHGAYAIGSLVGPSPANEPDNSVNFLHISAAGQAGCSWGEAPPLSKGGTSGAQVVALPLPAATTQPLTSAAAPVSTGAVTLASTSGCP